MRISKRQVWSVLAVLGLGAGLATAPAAPASADISDIVPGAPAPQTARRAATTQACTIYDGYATTGEKWGANPPKYEYGNSPYVGARYNSCSDVIRVYYGGYTNLTHYNVLDRVRGQRELKAGANMVWTVTPYASTDYWESFSVQGCVRGKWPNPSKCTRWSPTVWVHVTR